MPSVRQPCQDVRGGSPANRESRRDECLRPTRLMSSLRATAPGSCRKRYRAAFAPYAAGPGVS